MREKKRGEHKITITIEEKEKENSFYRTLPIRFLSSFDFEMNE
jgi:hypothetical protein